MSRPEPRLTALVALTLALLIPSAALAQERIEAFQVQGNEFISDEAFLALTDLEIGDVFEEEALQAEFWKVWETGLFEDLRIEAAEGPRGGQVVIFTVREKPRIDSVRYDKVKAFGEDRLQEILREENSLITVNSTLDEEKVGKTKKILEELLSSQGFPDARVSVDKRRVAPSRIALHFRIDAGPKVLIGELTFSGNQVFSDRELRKMLENTGQKWLGSFIKDRSSYYLPRLESDLAAVREAYGAKGYLDASVGQPDVRDLQPGKSGKEEKRLVSVDVPIDEGKPYRLGKLTVSGATVFTPTELRALIPLGEGEILNQALLNLGITRIDNIYGDAGHLYAVSSPRYVPDADRLVADVDVQVTENERYTVRRVEFDGNVRTRDEVLRREMRVQEGDVFSRSDYFLGLRKIGQLGFWELEGEPQIRPVDGPDPEVDINIRGREVGRNEIQFGGGFSGIDGLFATFSFSSRNFLGRGAQFQASGQLGGRTTTYSLSYVEPYVFNTQASLGGTLTARDRDFDGFDQEGRGASLTWAYPTSTFTSVRVTGRWESSKIVDDDNAAQDDEFTTYSLTPSFRLDTRNNPFRPSRGRNLSGSVEFGFSDDETPDVFSEGGNVAFLKPRFEFTQYWRTKGRQYAALHLEGGLLESLTSADERAVGGQPGTATDNVPSDLISPPYLPVFERYFLGGESSIRGVEIRSVGPRIRHFDSNGNLLEERAIGGNAYYLLNLEYTVPLSEIFELTFFTDIGNSFGVENLHIHDLVNTRHEDVIELIDTDPFDAKGTAGIEFRFHTPVLQQPLRLIYGCKVLGDFFDDEGSCDFEFSIGRTFQ
ncbi:MAG: outer membrane protein assembly factor BamA [Acidobacteriota bacterium]